MRNAKPLVLEVKGFHIPSFKNRKRAILDRNTGKHRTLTEPETKEKMEKIIRSFVSQLLLTIQTCESAICRGRSKLYATALLLPADDSLHWIPHITIQARKVDKGFEGAIIEITPIE